MGGKSGNAQAPDPRLAEAQIRSMGIQDDAIQRMMALEQEMLPLQREALQQGLAATRRAEGESADDRRWMLGRRMALERVQNDLVREADEFDTDARREELAGEAMADVNRGFSAARGQNARELARMGVDPSSGRALAIGEGSRVQQALALAGAGTQARTRARAEGRQMKAGIADMMAGYPAMASQQTGAGVGYGTGGINVTNTSAAGRSAPIVQAGGIAAQLGSNATSMFGQQAQREAQARNSGEGWGANASGIGSIMGGAAKMWRAWKGSDRRLKTDIQPVGRHERTGLALYEFAYKTNPGRRFLGVMADEVREVFPEAVQETKQGYLTVNYALLGIPFREVPNGLHQ